MKHYDETVVQFVLNIGTATLICPALKIALTSTDSQSNNTVIRLYVKDKKKKKESVTKESKDSVPDQYFLFLLVVAKSKWCKMKVTSTISFFL